MNQPKNPALFYGAIAVAVIFLALSVFYIIPGPYHPLTFSGTPTDMHPTHAVGFFAIAVVCVIAALVTRPKSTVRR